MSQPWRFWFTGAAAVVWAAVMQMPFREEAWLSRSSRHSVDETARRIELAARERGLPLFACLSPSGPGSLVMVLGTDAGGTPVLQQSPHGALALPLTVWLRSLPGPDGARVHFSDGRRLQARASLPTPVARHLDALPGLIEAAIRG